MRIPQRLATTLTGHDVTVPDAFTGSRNAVLFAFHPSHFVVQPSWHAALKPILSESPPNAGFYTLGLVTTAARWRQRLSAWALRLEVQDSFLQEHTALMFCERRAWQRDAQLFTLEEPVLVVATPDGDVMRMITGGPSSATIPMIAPLLTQN